MKKLGPEPLIDASASVQHSRLGRYTEVGARTSLTEVELGDYSYIVNDADAIYARIGKFCSIAAHTRINPGEHPIGRVSQGHFTYRASAYFADEKDDEAFFGWRRSRPVVIGHDVWIGHGAIVLAGRTVGSGSDCRGCNRDKGRSVLQHCGGRTCQGDQAAFSQQHSEAHRSAGLVGLGSPAVAHRAARFPHACTRGISREAWRLVASTRPKYVHQIVTPRRDDLVAWTCHPEPHGSRASP